MRLGVRSQKRTGIISILFAGILIWKYLTGNEHVKFYPWQDSQSPNISNICPSKTHGVLSKKWSCWSETNLRHRFGPIAFFRDDFPHQHFEKSQPGHFSGYVPRIWTQPQVGMSPYYPYLKLPILDILQLSLRSWYFCIKLGSPGPSWTPRTKDDLAVAFRHGSLNVPIFHITQPWMVYGL